MDKAIERLKIASEMSMMHYKKPLLITYSGGKDSAVLLDLAEKSEIPFEVVHSHTTVDAPETVYHVRKELHRLENKGVKCYVEKPKYKGEPTSMWKLIPQKKMPPTRIVRYCCSVLKETSGSNRFIATGVRWAESVKRKNRGIYETVHRSKDMRVILNNDNDDRRRLFETCTIQAKRTCNPIIDWSDDDIWNYTSSEKIKLNPVYNMGFDRVGCIGCPMARLEKRTKEFNIWPKYKENYIKSFDRMIEERKKQGMETEWKTGEEVFHWWMKDGILPGQISFEELMNE